MREVNQIENLKRILKEIEKKKNLTLRFETSFDFFSYPKYHTQKIVLFLVWKLNIHTN